MSRAGVTPETYRAAVKRALWKCEKCGDWHWLELHHILGRIPAVMVNEPDNLVLLCKGCHEWMHQSKTRALSWVEATFGSERLDRLQELRRGAKRVLRLP